MFPHVMGLVPSGTETAEPVLGRSVTTNFFSGARIASGSRPGVRRRRRGAAVLDYDYWKRRFNGDDGVVGQMLRINGRPVTVVGVAAPDFQGTGIQRATCGSPSGPTQRPAASGRRPRATGCVVRRRSGRSEDDRRRDQS